MGPRAGLDGGKSRPAGIRSPDRPARSQSLYRLSYAAHNYVSIRPQKGGVCVCVCVCVCERERERERERVRRVTGSGMAYEINQNKKHFQIFRRRKGKINYTIKV